MTEGTFFQTELKREKKTVEEKACWRTDTEGAGSDEGIGDYGRGEGGESEGDMVVEVERVDR